MTEQLVLLADRYCAATGLSRARVSTIVFNHGAKIDRVADGRDLETRSFERALQWFSDNWPADADWPGHIERPPASASGDADQAAVRTPRRGAAAAPDSASAETEPSRVEGLSSLSTKSAGASCDAPARPD